LDKWVRANDWVGRRLFFVVVAAVLLGFMSPLPKMSYTKDIVFVIFAYITFVTSLGTGFRKFLEVLKKPLIAVWILCLLHLGVPVFAWGLGHLFYAGEPVVRLGLLIISAIPLAVTAILWTSIAQGNLGLTIMAVTLDTLIAPLLLPVLFMLFVGAAIEIDYAGMVLQLFGMVTLPSLIAMFLTDRLHGRLDGFAKGVGGLSSRLALFLVVYFNASAVAPEISLSAQLVKLLLVVFLLVISGYVLGYFGSFVFAERDRDLTITMMYSVGMRNISFGLVLALAYFPTAVAIPVTLSALFQQPTAALTNYVFERIYGKK